MGEKNSKMTYNEFLAVFEEGRADSYDAAPRDHPYPQVLNQGMPAEAAEDKMRRKIAANAEVLHRVGDRMSQLTYCNLLMPQYSTSGH